MNTDIRTQESLRVTRVLVFNFTLIYQNYQVKTNWCWREPPLHLNFQTFTKKTKTKPCLAYVNKCLLF